MHIFLHILQTNIIPIFILIIAGFVVQKKLSLDVKVLSKLLFNLYIPVLVFIKLSEIDVSVDILGSSLIFLVIFSTLLFGLAILYLKIIRLKNNQGAFIINSTLFYNSANYGIPLVLLVFPGDPLAFSVQIVVVLIQTILIFTVGVITVNAGKKSMVDILKTIGKIPVIHAIIFSLLFRIFNIQFPDPVYVPINYIADGYIAIALVTLGIQLANISWKIKGLQDIFVLTSFRLLLAPILAFFLVLILGLEGTVAQVLIISSSAPTAVNSAMLAIEYDNKPETVSQIVLVSTLASAFTLPLVIMFVKFIF